MAKNFAEYAQKRIGLMPRPLSLNNSERIINELISRQKDDCANINVVEFGFNHGNDSRHIIRILLDRLGENGWKFWGYDHEDYFMPENVFHGFTEEETRIIRSNTKLIPCYFEDLAFDPSSFPEQIDFCYSNKSLSMVQREYFFDLMDQISLHISPMGIMCCSLHVYSEKDPTYYSKDDYIKMLEGRYHLSKSGRFLFADFESIADFTDEKYFSFIATKTGVNSLKMQSGIANNESELLYEKAFRNEK